MPINRDVLRWARERIQLSYDDAAEGAGVKPQQIEEWESGPRVPTVRQARKLAQVYDRPFLEFFCQTQADGERADTGARFPDAPGGRIPEGKARASPDTI